MNQSCLLVQDGLEQVCWVDGIAAKLNGKRVGDSFELCFHNAPFLNSQAKVEGNKWKLVVFETFTMLL